jgi:hypothetical protein
MSVGYPNFRKAIILGSIGWILVLFPACFRDYGLLVSGELIRLGTAFFSGSLTSQPDKTQVAFLGLQIGPLAAAAALLSLYTEASRCSGTMARQGASLIAGLMLTMSAVTGIWLFSNALPAPGYAGPPFRIGAIIHAGFLCSWALLFVVFAVSRSPLRSAMTRPIAGLIAAEASLLTAIFILLECRHWLVSGAVPGPARLLVVAVELAPWALMFAFLMATRRESAALSRRQAASSPA